MDTPAQFDRRTVLKTTGAGLASGLLLPASAAAGGGGLSRELAVARSATAEYNDPEEAVDDGYVHVVPGEGPVPLEAVVEEGHAVCGMGFHFVHPDRIGSTDITAPTVLVYGVDDEGELLLGAVEWIVPKAGPYETTPPDLFEHDGGAEAWEEDSPFPGVWALHAWVHTHNPDGVFNPTNPREQFHPHPCEGH